MLNHTSQFWIRPSIIYPSIIMILIPATCLVLLFDNGSCVSMYQVDPEHMYPQTIYPTHAVFWVRSSLGSQLLVLRVVFPETHCWPPSVNYSGGLPLCLSLGHVPFLGVGVYGPVIQTDCLGGYNLFILYS